MTNEEAIKILKKRIGCFVRDSMDCFKYDISCSNCEYNMDNSDLTEALNTAIKALESIDDDLIRRQDALNCFHCWIDKHGDVVEPCDMAEYRAIENLPAVMEEME